MAETPRLPLFVAGLGRAGTTLLTNMFTSPPDRWLSVEPGITRSDMVEHVRQQAHQLELPMTEQECAATLGEYAVGRFDRLLAGSAARLQRWGVNAVNSAGWDYLISRFQPARVVPIVRNLRDAGISVLGIRWRFPGARKTPDWLCERLSSAAQVLVHLLGSLPPGDCTVVRYEDCVASEEYRRALATAINWPLDGDPEQRLELFGRCYKRERHAGQVTTGSACRAKHELSAGKGEFASRLQSQSEAFVLVFEYA